MKYGFRFHTSVHVNILLGIHSLTAAKAGRRVVAIEPLTTNIVRLHQSVLLNNLTSNYVLVKNAISDIRKDVEMTVNPRNLAGSSMVNIFKSKTGKKETVSTILMDDLLEVITFKEAVMKIDIEGNEVKAFVHAEKLFALIKIHCIFMEWMLMKDLLANYSEQKVSVMNLVAFLQRHKYKPYANGHLLNLEDINEWPIDILWELQP